MKNESLEDTNPINLNSGNEQEERPEDTQPTLVSSQPTDKGGDQEEMGSIGRGIAGGAPEESSSLTQETATPARGSGENRIGDDITTGVKPPKKKRFAWLLIVVLCLLALLLVGMISAFGGYRSGISLRKNAESTQIAQVAFEQYQLGIQDLEQGEYFRARQRFEYVIQLDPDYPGVTERLAEVLLELNTTATPTLLPTATVTPTPDLRSVQELYDQGKQYLMNSDWTNAIEALLMLRKTDQNFNAVEVDGMLYLALRNRGKDKILLEADLEGGIYDLTLASRFGPLDTEAQGLLNWTSLYITGISFWEIDWIQVVDYLVQVVPQVPNLTDGSGWTATERLRIAFYENGNAYARQGQYCQAVDQYQQSLSIAQDPQVQEALTLAVKGCSQKSEPGKPKDTPEPGGS